jgi:hypothetical protein
MSKRVDHERHRRSRYVYDNDENAVREAATARAMTSADAVASIERTQQCMQAGERMLARLREKAGAS